MCELSVQNYFHCIITKMYQKNNDLVSNGLAHRATSQLDVGGYTLQQSTVICPTVVVTEGPAVNEQVSTHYNRYLYLCLVGLKYTYT